MPNQSDPNQPKVNTQTTGQSTASSAPVVSPQSDLPPLPPEISGNEETASLVQDRPNDSIITPASQPPPAAASSPPIISTTPKKKFGGGKVIATILGILLLVGGVGAGLILTQQIQNPFSRANILECFPAGTKISLANGEKESIENMKAGDSVLSENEQGNLSQSSTTKLLKLWSFNMCSVDFVDGEILKLTNPHPLFTKEGWKAIDVAAAKYHNPGLSIGQLANGDLVKKEDGSWDQISSISCSYGLFRVYNLTVDNNHDFFADGYLAHNKGGSRVVDNPDKTTVLNNDGKKIKEIEKTGTEKGVIKNYDPKDPNTPTSIVRPGDPGSQPQGTYAVYENGASSGKVVGYRYIQAAGVFEGAISRAAAYLNDITKTTGLADLALLQSQYGMSTADIKDAQSHIAAGETWAPPGVGGINTWHWTTCTNKGTGMSGIGCDVIQNGGGGGGGGGGGSPTPYSTPKLSPTPSPTPTITAQCSGVKAYLGANFVPLSTEAIATLKPGDILNFCVNGTASSGLFDTAQFNINTTTYAPTTTKRTGTSDYCQSYAVKSGDTNIDVKAKIHHSILGWVGENFQ